MLGVGAGEGGDAVWLAEHGWNVTASDISQRAPDRIAAVAPERSLPITCHHADANSVDPYAAHSFELVSAHYASIPRSPDGRGINDLRWPGTQIHVLGGYAALELAPTARNLSGARAAAMRVPRSTSREPTRSSGHLR